MSRIICGRCNSAMKAKDFSTGQEKALICCTKCDYCVRIVP